VLRAAKTGRALHKQHRFDVIITSGPPHSAHFAGLLVALGAGSVPRIMDMRDPWRGGNTRWPIYGMDPRWVFPLIGPLERILFRNTRTVIVNTREFAEDLQRAQPNLSVVHLSNGIDPEHLPARTAERFREFTIAYLGTFYAGRSFATLLAALKAVVQSRPHDAVRPKLRIAGHMDAAEADLLREVLARDGLADLVLLHGRIPRSEALDILRKSHLALVLAQEQRTQIPAKLYECIGLGVPTLVITEPGSAAARESSRLGALAVDSEDLNGMRRIIEALLEGQLPARVQPETSISYEALATQLHGLLAARCTPSPIEIRKPVMAS
jgi:glycosyltransferase involved in cell wall biosynthesis